MNLLTSTILILVITLVYYFIIKVFSILFRITGLTKEKARFQAISLFTNCGYTTHESEMLTSHPVRRRLAIIAMITGHVFSAVIVSLVINLMLSVKPDEIRSSIGIVITLIGCFILLLVISKIPFISNGMTKLIETLAIKATTRKSKNNTITILDDYGHECIAQISIRKLPGFMEDKTLMEMEITKKYKISILMIIRRGKNQVVNPNSRVEIDDVLVVFGDANNIQDCFTLSNKEIESIIETSEKVNVVKLVSSYDKEAMVEVTINTIPEVFKDKPLSKMRIKEDYGINVLSISRFGKPIMLDSETTFIEGDTVALFGSYTQIKKIFLNNDY